MPEQVKAVQVLSVQVSRLSSLELAPVEHQRRQADVLPSDDGLVSYLSRSQQDRTKPEDCHLRPSTKLRDHLLDLDLPTIEDGARMGPQTLKNCFHTLRRRRHDLSGQGVKDNDHPPTLEPFLLE